MSTPPVCATEPHDYSLLETALGSFEPAINDAAERVQESTQRWLQHTRLVEGEQAKQRVLSTRAGELSARACPRAPLTVLELVSRWNTWLFLRDDVCDQTDVGRKPERTSRMNREHLEVLCGRSRGSDPLSHALADLHAQLVAAAGDHVRPSWLHAVEQYMHGCRWEAANRRLGRVPTLREYVTLRRFTGGLLPNLELFAALGGFTLTPWVRADPDVCELLDAANDAICWTNDIFSEARERAAGDVHNLVLVLEHHHHLPPGWAFRQAQEMIADRIRRFIELEPIVWATHSSCSSTRTFTFTLRWWMRGNLDWSRRCPRYRSSNRSSPGASHDSPTLQTARLHEPLAPMNTTHTRKDDNVRTRAGHDALDALRLRGR